MIATTSAPGARDGRAERSARTRAAVVDALLALIHEGDLRPTAPRVAARAGVSLRTVFHHFDDMESLLALAADRQMERVASIIRRVPREDPLRARIAAFVAGRARLHEAITPVRRAALLAEPFSQAVAARLAWTRQRARREVERVFAPEIARRSPRDRRDLVEAVTCAASWPAWESLRTHQQLAPPHARRVMERTITALLKED